MFWLIVLCLAGVLAAAIAHELTHVVTARALGATTEVKAIRRGESVLTTTLVVDYALEATEPLWKDRLIGLAPLLVGLLVGLGTVAIAGLPSLSERTIIGAATWTMYTLTGGIEDYRV